MDRLAPLLHAPPVTVLHAACALAGFVLGVVQLAGPKGTTAHRVIGWAWVLLLGTVAVSSFAINDIRQFGPFSPIHLLSVMTLVMLPIGVMRARQHRAKAHGRMMTGLFVGALLIAGLFTLAPGRIMHAVVFGG
jgi:uncharacterized membrane protein